MQGWEKYNEWYPAIFTLAFSVVCVFRKLGGNIDLLNPVYIKHFVSLLTYIISFIVYNNAILMCIMIFLF